jgi:hypothetical protein
MKVGIGICCTQVEYANPCLIFYYETQNEKKHFCLNTRNNKTEINKENREERAGP